MAAAHGHPYCPLQGASGFLPHDGPSTAPQVGTRKWIGIPQATRGASVHMQQSWTAPVALMISAALIAGCTGDSPNDVPTTAAVPPTPQAPPSTEPSPTGQPSEDLSLDPAEQALTEAESVYREWIEFRNEILQDPPPIAGNDAEADAAFQQLLTDTRRLAVGDAEGRFVSAVGQYDEQGWRQVGGNEVQSVSPASVQLDSAGDGPPSVDLNVCLVPSDDFGVVTSDGNPAPEFSDVENESLPLRITLLWTDTAVVEGWRVESSERRDGTC
jgi:hypothetical protein